MITKHDLKFIEDQLTYSCDDLADLLVGIVDEYIERDMTTKKNIKEFIEAMIEAKNKCAFISMSIDKYIKKTREEK